MAKDKEKEVTLIDAFKDFKEEKSIDRPVMLGVLRDVFLTQLAKTYGSADNFDVISVAGFSTSSTTSKFW